MKTDTLATRVLVDRTRAIGIEFRDDQGHLNRISAQREVVVSLEFSTRHNSSCSPASVRRITCANMKIIALADLPVGKFQDHLMVLNLYTRKSPGNSIATCDWTAWPFICCAHISLAAAMRTTMPSGLIGFVKTRPELAVPDLEFLVPISPPYAHLWFPGVKASYADAFGLRPIILHPESRGDVTLRSANPLDPVASASIFCQRQMTL